jgi:pectate lyase
MTYLKYVSFSVLAFSLVATPAHIANAQGLPAFPGAEGFGALATGGRGGVVVKVTNLNESGPGSFREAMEMEVPRIIVFEVGGEITLSDDIRLRTENSNVTVAGQTAPGDGITLRNINNVSGQGETAPIVLDGGVNNVIIRFIRSRPGPSLDPSSNVRGITNSGTNVIIDHCSFSWSTDEIYNSWNNASDITIQWSIFSEGLSMSNHPDTLENGLGHSRGPFVGDSATRVSFHHNLVAHFETRGPRFKNGDADVVNNVNYNMQQTATRLDNGSNQTPGHFNYVGNYIKEGPDSTWDHELKIRDDSSSVPSIVQVYLEGNIGKNRTDNSQDEDLIVDSDSLPSLVGNHHAFPLVTTTTAFTAYDQVLANAGVTVPKRDPVDTRIVAEVQNGTGRIIDHPNEVGGWPALNGGAPPQDSDDDGMPDSWEWDRGLDPNDPTDPSADRDGDGYTNIEEYINGLAGGGSPPPPNQPPTVVIISPS